MVKDKSVDNRGSGFSALVYRRAAHFSGQDIASCRATYGFPKRSIDKCLCEQSTEQSCQCFERQNVSIKCPITGNPRIGFWSGSSWRAFISIPGSPKINALPSRCLYKRFWNLGSPFDTSTQKMPLAGQLVMIAFRRYFANPIAFRYGSQRKSVYFASLARSE